LDTSDAQDDPWEEVIRELRDLGLSPKTILDNKSFIASWVKDADSNGELDEVDPLVEGVGAIPPIRMEGLLSRQHVNAIDSASSPDALHRPRSIGDFDSASEIWAYRDSEEAIARPQPSDDNESQSGLMAAGPEIRRSKSAREARESIPPSSGALGSPGLQPSSQAQRSNEMLTPFFSTGSSRTSKGDRETRRLSPMQSFSRVIPSLHRRELARVDNRLMNAIEKADVEETKRLLDFGASFKDLESQSFYALHTAAKQGSLEMARFLIERGFLASAVDHKGATPLHLACEYGHIEFVELMLRQAETNVNATDLRLATPLHYACCSEKGRFVTLVRRLLDRGAMLEAENAVRETPLLALMHELDKWVNAPWSWLNSPEIPQSFLLIT
jgi:hypothetical protein